MRRQARLRCTGTCRCKTLLGIQHSIKFNILVPSEESAVSHPALTNNSRGIVFMQSPGLSWSHFRSCSSLSHQWVIAGIFRTALMKYCCSLNEATSSQQAVQRCTVPDATLSRLRSNTLSKLMQSGSRALADSVGLADFGGASSFQSMPSLSAGRRQ